MTGSGAARLCIRMPTLASESSSATGGTGVATVYITNAGAISVKGNGEGIGGFSAIGWAIAGGGYNREIWFLPTPSP